MPDQCIIRHHSRAEIAPSKIAIICTCMPVQMDDAASPDAIKAEAAETGAAWAKNMDKGVRC